MDEAPGLLDVELVARVAEGSEMALAQLYDRHGSTVFAAAYRLGGDRATAEEVVQETFLALWDRAETFNAAVGSLLGWLLAIARNRTVDRLRAAGRRPSLAFSSVVPDDVDHGAALERLVAAGELLGGAAQGRGPEEELEASELRATIAGALATMPDPERQVILLAYRDGLSQSEIAARLDWPLGTVKTRTRRALRALRSALGEPLAAEEAGASEEAAVSVGPRLVPRPADGGALIEGHGGGGRGDGGLLGGPVDDGRGDDGSR